MSKLYRGKRKPQLHNRTEKARQVKEDSKPPSTPKRQNNKRGSVHNQTVKFETLNDGL